MHTYHVFISGFLQRVSATNGIVRLALRKKASVDPATDTVDYYSHRFDTLNYAQYISAHNGKKRVCVYAYSYGCHAARKLAWDLEEVGLRANIMVLCDPVAKYHYGYTMAPRCLRKIIGPMPLIGRPKLRYPSSVGTIYLFEQDIAPPWSSRVFHGKHRVPPTPLPYPHTAMDNSDEFADLVLSI